MTVGFGATSRPRPRLSRGAGLPSLAERVIPRSQRPAARRVLVFRLCLTRYSGARRLADSEAYHLLHVERASLPSAPELGARMAPGLEDVALDPHGGGPIAIHAVTRPA